MDFRDVTNIFLTVHAGNLGDLDTDTYREALFEVLAELFPNAFPHIDMLDRVTGTEPDADVWATAPDMDVEIAQRIVRDARQTAFDRACLAA